MNPEFLIKNPVLPGFHPDPSILRVQGDFYIATSTFEWFPGVRIHHSRDLRHFRALGYALDRPSQLDLHGSPRSGGVWAPCLSHDGQRFHLLYTDVKSWGHGFVDAHNYLVTAERIEGPWSERIALNSSGFDPSLFHDEDGRKWLVNVVWDHRPGRDHFGGVLLQEYSAAEKRLIGQPQRIFQGTSLGCTEGPHLYRHGGLYYLMVAEGGTSYDHAVTLARSEQLSGPYHADPDGPLLTARHDPSLALQKSGHGSLVETPSGEWYLAHLCGRPIGAERRCILGRETALQRVRWTADGWLRLDEPSGGAAPRMSVPAPNLATHSFPERPARDEFDALKLGPDYQTLRDPADPSWLSLSARPGWLRLIGRESPQSLHRQSLLGRRIQALHCRIETCLEFRPESYQELAGLICLYDDQNFFYAHLTHDETSGRSLSLLGADRGKLVQLAGPVPCAAERIYLRAELELTQLRFFASEDGQEFHALGPELDATQLSDEYTTLGLGFTGAYAALAAHDLSGGRRAADFDYFEYREW